VRTQRKQPGKKSGARIKNRVAVIPLGMKRSKYEISARSALLAMKHNVHNEQQGAGHRGDADEMQGVC